MPRSRQRRAAVRAAMHRVAGRRVRLAAFDPRSTPAFDGDKDEAAPLLERLNDRLEQLQELLFAEGRHRLLVVLQGMDTSGKDGVIRRVFEGVNPQGVRVASFKVPTPAELAHDFLWRVHPQVPGDGQITIFNRSHYEDVLVVRVRELAPEAVWRRRYDQIRDFERLLHESGTTILKFFLHISPEEQAERLRERLADPLARWKFRRGDLEERQLWWRYVEAYEAAIERTHTAWAPWYVIPSDRKWYRNLVISQILVDTLEGLAMRWPEGEAGVDGLAIGPVPRRPLAQRKAAR